MTDERLKEIKDSIYCLEYDFAVRSDDIFLSRHLQHERELYNEVVRLRKILNCKEELCKYLPKDTEFVVLTKGDYERNKLTLEQLTGVENE